MFFFNTIQDNVLLSVSRSKSLGSSTSTQSFVGKVELIKHSRRNLLRSSSLPQLLPTYFVDHTGPILHLYGDGALETLENVPNPSHGPSIEEVHFHYMEFEEIAPLLSKMSRGFPHVRVSCSW